MMLLCVNCHTRENRAHAFLNQNKQNIKTMFFVVDTFIIMFLVCNNGDGSDGIVLVV